MLNLIFKNYKKYHENQRKKLRRLIYISSKSNFDAQTLLLSFTFLTKQAEHEVSEQNFMKRMSLKVIRKGIERLISTILLQ